jgi:hypothetical protein
MRQNNLQSHQSSKNSSHHSLLNRKRLQRGLALNFRVVGLKQLCYEGRKQRDITHFNLPYIKQLVCNRCFFPLHKHPTTISSSFCGTGVRTLDLTVTRQALYHLSHFASPNSNFLSIYSVPGSHYSVDWGKINRK